VGLAPFFTFAYFQHDSLLVVFSMEASIARRGRQEKRVVLRAMIEKFDQDLERNAQK
jgi:hypothetical protein